MSMTYAQFVMRVTDLMGVNQTDFDLTFVIPDIIDYAEQRCYRELNLLSTVIADATASLSANSRSFTLPSGSGRFVTIETINCITPNAVTPANGTRNPLTPVTLRFLNFASPVEVPSGTSVPMMYAMVTDQSLVVAPTPNLAYGMEVVGTIRPTPLSSSNPTTYLTLYLPDLFLSAAMIHASAHRPDMQAAAPGWEADYQRLLKSANAEEVRRRYTIFFNRASEVEGASAGTLQ